MFVEIVDSRGGVGVQDLQYDPISRVLLWRAYVFHLLDRDFVVTIWKYQKSVTQGVGDASISFGEIERGHRLFFVYHLFLDRPASYHASAAQEIKPLLNTGAC